MRIYTGLDVNSDFGGRFPWKSHFVDHGSVRQAYVDEGPREAQVTFACLHGNPTWGFLYREFIKRLSKTCRVIAVDHVGFGRSDKPRDPAYYTIERHVENLERLLSEVGAHNVIPILHDWGGPIGMGWATRHPEHVAGVVILNTTAFVHDPVPNLPRLFKLLTGGWKRAVENNFFVEMFVARVGTARHMTKEDLDPYRAPFPTPDDRMGVARMPNIWEGGNPGYETYVSAVATEAALPALHEKPALICWALSDRAFHRQHLARWQYVFANVDGPHLLPKARHFLQEDAAAEILDQHPAVAKPSWSWCVSPRLLQRMGAMMREEQQEGARNMSHMNLRVLVIGAGLGGLCLAQGLRRAGVEVAVYERDAGLAVRTQGHRVHLDARGEQALHQCLPPSLYDLFLATRGQHSRGVTMYSEVSGQLKEGVSQLSPESKSLEFVTVGSAVDRLTLRQVLLAGLDDSVHFNQAFAGYEQLDDGQVCASFTDGTRATGDVLVAADGVGSRIRQQFLPRAQVLDTGTRWLGGKTPLTDEIIGLLPASMHESFAVVFGPHPTMMLGCVWFRMPPKVAARQFWPNLRFQHTQDYLMWGLLGGREQFPIPDEDLQAMESAALSRLAVELTHDWYPALSPLTELADPEESFFLTMRRSIPLEHWQSSTITLPRHSLQAC